MVKKAFYPLLIILIACIPLYDLTKSGVFRSHDFIEHSARLASFYQSLKEGNLVPRWGGNLNYGYGHPVLMFLYSLTNYLGSLIHFLGFSVVDTIKMIIAIAYILSGLFMYWFAKNLFGIKVGIIASVFYLFAPYRFVDIYVRAALGEHLALAIIPLCLLLMTKFIRRPNKIKLIIASVSIALLILAHNALSLMFLPFLVIYSIYLPIVLHRKFNLLAFPGAFILGFGLAAFFWLPAFIEGQYTLRDIVTPKEFYANAFINWQELFYSKWGYGYAAHKGGNSGFMVSLSFFQWLSILAAIWIFFKKRSIQYRKLLLVTIIFSLLAAYLMTNLSAPILPYLPLVSRFQFPWRFLAIPVVGTSILAAYVVKAYDKKIRYYSLIAICLVVILSTATFWKIEKIDRFVSDDELLQNYTSTTDTGESTPRWAIRFQESYPPQKVQLAWGQLTSVNVKKWNFEVHEYQVVTGEDSQLVDNTLFFPGWKVFVDGVEVPIQFQDQNWRGIITYPVDMGLHQIMVKFSRTGIRKIADSISLSSLIALLIIFFIPVHLCNQKTKK